MSKSRFALSIVTLLALTPAAHAGGAGSGSAATGGTAAAPAATGGTAQMAPGATGGTSGTTGGTAEVPVATGGTVGVAVTTGGTAVAPSTTVNPASPQQAAQQAKQIQVNEQRAATTGSNTRPSAPNSGVVSAPGVGVGHAANGLPIGSPGSGLGSPEQSRGPATRH